MRFGFADPGRVGGAVDTIPFRREPDPIGSHWVIRPGFDRESLFGSYPFEFVIRIVAVVRIGIRRDDLKRAIRRWFLLASNRGREEGNELARGRKSFDRLTRLVDF